MALVALPLPPPPQWLAVGSFPMSVVSFGASSSAQVSWSRYPAASFNFTPLHYPVLPLLIYLSVCPSVSTTYFSLYSASLRLCLCLFVLMYLNNSDPSPHTFLLLLSLYIAAHRRPPTLPLSLSKRCNGPHCGPLVVLHGVQKFCLTLLRGLSHFLHICQ